jgi:peptidoglycan/xylan/chitin deacetylase (PgdA/CDA1 family)
MPARRHVVASLLAVLLCACGGSPNGSTAVATGDAPTMPETTASPIEETPAEPTATATALPATPRPTGAAQSPGARPALTPPTALAGQEWTRLPTDRAVVALTFDAGGNNAGVASILATLAQQHVAATFFLTGRWTEVYPADARRIAAAHAVGNHTQTHPHLTGLGDAAVAAEITQGAQAIQSATGRTPRPLFRFPYGDSNQRVLDDVHRLGYGGIRWTVDTLGWEGRGAGQSVDTVVARAVGAATAGEIVLMHVGSAQDGTTLDADALARIITDLRARGYSFATLAEFTGPS